MGANEITIQYLQTPVGELILGASGEHLCLCDWRYRSMRNTIDKRIQQALDASYKEGEDPLFNRLQLQLAEYFEGTRTEFDIPWLPIGSDFQKRVWQALLEIPYGDTMSYLSLAKKLGDEKAIRAVASANGANALSIIIPCHRIIGAKGEMVGYAGGLQAKKQLLKLENRGHRPEQLELFE